MAFEANYFAANYRDYGAQNPPRKLACYRGLVLRHADASLPRRVHDIGCALGLFLGAMPDDWELYGSDVSEFAVARARERVPRGAFQVASAVDAPWPEAFAAVTAFDVIEHIPDIDRVAEAVWSQLLPGGVFVFVVPVYDGLSGPIIRRLDHDVTHVNKWPRRQWLEWAAGRFEVIEWIGLARYLVAGRIYPHLSTRRWRGHTPAIGVVARRRA
jgi:SAM-dependent methyltransferase